MPAISRRSLCYSFFRVVDEGAKQLADDRGELVMLYSFIWLLFAARGGGAYSVDAALDGRRRA
ncbi:MAG: hypothetical protein ABIP66_20780 [Gemmatimonadaceae bacterium]